MREGQVQARETREQISLSQRVRWQIRKTEPLQPGEACRLEDGTYLIGTERGENVHARYGIALVLDSLDERAQTRLLRHMNAMLERLLEEDE
jgi:hypothetical protein